MNAIKSINVARQIRYVHVIFFLLLMIAVGGYPQLANAQANPEISNCEELKDEATITQMDFCTAHVGCRLVMGIHSACTKVKKFLANLRSIGDRDAGQESQDSANSVFGKFKSLLGGKPAVSTNQVFEASLGDVARDLEAKNQDWKASAAVVKTGVAKAGDSVLSGKLSNGGEWTYLGDVKDGKAEGWGAKFYSTGAIVRGEFKNGVADGLADTTFSDGQRQTGQFSQNQLNGDGISILTTGNIYKGKFQAGSLYGSGAMYRPDGTLLERGSYEKDKLVNGDVYDSSGKIVKRVDKVMDAMLAAEAQQKTQAERMAREAEVRRVEEERQQAIQLAAEQKRKDAIATSERAYRDSLSSMNAGQLFAKADELSTAGDKTKAREVLRTLLGRFPEHPLAATAAQQMSNLSSQQATNSQNGSGTASRSSSAPTCKSALDRLEAKLYQLDAGVSNRSNERIMMQQVWAQQKFRALVTNYPGCTASDRENIEGGVSQNQQACRSGGFAGDCNSGYDAYGWSAAVESTIAEIMRGAGGVRSDNNAGNTSTQNCESLLASQEREFEAVNRRPMPDGATPPLRRVMWMTSERIKLVKANCPSTSKYQQMIQELQSAYDQSEKACGQMMAGNVCPGPNAY